MSVPYETFDVDLRDGKAREDAFVHVLLRSTVEHKRDKKAAVTGNVAIEYEVVRGEEKEPSGISITTAERWAIEFAPECWILMPTERVKQLARLAIKDGRHAWIGDGKNHHNALIPIEWLVKAFEVVT